MDEPNLAARESSISAIYEEFLTRLERSVITSINDRRAELLFGTLTAGSVMILPVSDFNFRSSLDAEIEQLIIEGAASSGEPLSPAEVERLTEQIAESAEKSNLVTFTLIQKAFNDTYDIDLLQKAARTAILILLIRAIFARRKREVPNTATFVAVSSFNSGAHTAALLSGKITKTWVSQRDAKVRITHRKLDGDTVRIDEPFFVEGIPIRFPGDPTAPLHLIMQCRCFLRYGIQPL